MLYIRLFHGRDNVTEDMDDWGSDGPVFGPYKFAHTTYSTVLKLGRPDGGCDELYIHPEDLLYYDSVYYGDWSVFGEDELKEDDFEVSRFEPKKAEIPELRERIARVIVYIKGGICQDVKTNIPDEYWNYAIVDYDNEPDLPDDHIPFSKEQMEPFM